MKYSFTDGTSIEVSSTDEPEMYNLIKELVKAQTDKTKAETAKINLEIEKTKALHYELAKDPRSTGNVFGELFGV